MLLISTEQINTFSKYMLSNFIKTAFVYLREHRSASTADYSDKELAQFIKNGINIAKKYNITERNDVIIFLEYMLVHKIGLDENENNAWAKRILLLRNTSGTDKVTRMIKHTPLIPETKHDSN